MRLGQLLGQRYTSLVQDFILDAMTPLLHRDCSVEHFRRAYWLKRDLLEFCRRERLSPAGGKLDLTERIARYLESGRREESPKPSPPQRQGKIAGPLLLTTIIPEGCRCSQDVRAFFEQELGAGFHFNQVMREYLWNNPGRTLGDAAQAWRAAREQRTIKREIAPQFEYNRFTRAFYEAHPGVSRAEVIEAWKRERARRESECV